MRIVLIHRYFWPDTPPYANILREIGMRLADAGHDVTILTCQPSYNPNVTSRAPATEQLAPNLTVRRWSVLPDRRSDVLKALNMVLFCARLLLARVRLTQVDVVMAASTPPVALAKTASWLARLCGAKFVYHKQDIYPEVVLAPGMLRSTTAGHVLRAIDAHTDRRAARVVVLSEDMAETIAARGVERRSIIVLNNFDPWVLDEDAGGALTTAPRPADDSLRLVFAGNLGRFQSIDTIIDAMEELGPDAPVTLDFLGDGAMRNELECRASASGLSNVRFRGYQPPNEVARVLQEEADLGVVSLTPGVIKAAYPSKTMSYLRQGCPILVIVESGTELAHTLLSEGAGVQVNPGDAHGLAKVLMDLAGRRDELGRMRAHAQGLYRSRFAADQQLARWAELFEQLAPSSAGPGG